MAEKIAKSRTRNNFVPHGIHVEDHVDYQHVQNFMDKTDHARPNNQHHRYQTDILILHFSDHYGMQGHSLAWIEA